jgi:hypothetical protein
MRERQSGDRRQTQMRRRFDSPVPGDDPILIVDQHRVGKTEFPHAVSDPPDLLPRMSSGVARVRFKPADRANDSSSLGMLAAMRLASSRGVAWASWRISANIPGDCSLTGQL